MSCLHLDDGQVSSLSINFHTQVHHRPSDGHCFHLSTEVATFEGCQDICGLLNGTLATIMQHDYKRIFATFRDTANSAASDSPWWIGLYKDALNDWSWLNGVDFDSSWSNWVDDRPPASLCGENRCAGAYPPSNKDLRTKFFPASCSNITMPCLCESPGTVGDSFFWAKDELVNGSVCELPALPLYHLAHVEGNYYWNAFLSFGYLFFLVIYSVMSLKSCITTGRAGTDAEIAPQTTQEVEKGQSEGGHDIQQTEVSLHHLNFFQRIFSQFDALEIVVFVVQKQL